MKQSVSYRLLRALSFLVFFIAVLLFVTSQVVSIAPKTVTVRDNDRQAIGYASIPHDNGTTGFLLFSLTILSGIQFWTVFYIGKKESPRTDGRRNKGESSRPGNAPETSEEL